MWRCSKRRAFTLVELLLTVTIIGVLLALLMPALGAARDQAADLQCQNNLRLLGLGIMNYAAQNHQMYPPLADWRAAQARYWWGLNADPPDFSAGLLAPYLGHEAGSLGSLFECPMQPWGSYEPQGATSGPTTTYGYNGYYLCPAGTPGWAQSIGRRPWRTTRSVREPGCVFMLADTLMSWGAGRVTNNCLLDPPWTYSRGRWRENPFTTMCFRHGGRANVCFADAHLESVEPTRLIDQAQRIGYVGDSNAPHYVPDWNDW